MALGADVEQVGLEGEGEGQRGEHQRCRLDQHVGQGVAVAEERAEERPHRLHGVLTHQEQQQPTDGQARHDSQNVGDQEVPVFTVRRLYLVSVV